MLSPAVRRWCLPPPHTHTLSLWTCHRQPRPNTPPTLPSTPQHAISMLLCGVSWLIRQQLLLPFETTTQTQQQQQHQHQPQQNKDGSMSSFMHVSISARCSPEIRASNSLALNLGTTFLIVFFDFQTCSTHRRRCALRLPHALVLPCAFHRSLAGARPDQGVVQPQHPVLVDPGGAQAQPRHPADGAALGHAVLGRRWEHALRGSGAVRQKMAHLFRDCEACGSEKGLGGQMWPYTTPPKKTKKKTTARTADQGTT